MSKSVCSLRRVATTLVAVGFVFLSYSIFASGVTVCSGATACAAALSLYSFDVGAPHAISTIPSADVVSVNLALLNQAVQIVSLYLLIGGAIVLIGLEFSKPLPGKKVATRRTVAQI